MKGRIFIFSFALSVAFRWTPPCARCPRCRFAIYAAEPYNPALVGYPDAGPVVPGSGGVRKLRWAVAGRGKRGGIRVIYYWKRSDDEIWMLTMYGKSETSTIPAHILRRIAKEIEDV